MNNSFKKNLIAASVGAVLAAGSMAASANSLLFPYFTTVGSAQSVLSISTNSAAAPAGEDIHYVYNYGSSCTHYDGHGKMTNNDLLQHGVLDPIAGGFGKVTSSDGSTPFYFPLHDYGFVVVSSRTTGVAKIITGDMAVFDPATGLAVSYAGISNGLDTTIAGNEGDFSAITDSAYNLSFYPNSLVDTSWYGVVAGNMNAAISTNADWTGGATLTNNGLVYDNDEVPKSGTVTKDLVCGGQVLPTNLMNSAQQVVIGPNGGLIHANAGAFINGATGVLMAKIQTVKAAVGAPFAGNTVLHTEQGNAF